MTYMTGGGWSTLATSLGNTSPDRDVRYFVVNDLTSSLYAGNDISTTSGAIGATIVGSYAGGQNQGSYNSFFGAHTGKKTESGFNNTFLGSFSGASNITGNESTYVGAFAGNASRGSRNTFLGYGAGDVSLGQNNIYLGHKAGALDGSQFVNNAIALGNASYTGGEYGVVIGHNAVSTTTSSNAIVLGHNSKTTSPDSMVLGNNIVNYGSNVFLVQTSVPYGFADDQKYVNYESDVININDKFIMGTGADNSRFELLIDDVFLGSDASSIRISPSNILLSSPNLDFSAKSNVLITGASNISLSNSAGWVNIGPTELVVNGTKELILSNNSNAYFELNGMSGIRGSTVSNIVLDNPYGSLAISKSNAGLYHEAGVSVLTGSETDGGSIGLIGTLSNLRLLGWSNSIEFYKDGDMAVTTSCNLFIDAGSGTNIVTSDTYVSIDADGISMSTGAYGVGIVVDERSVNVVGPMNISSNLSVGGSFAVAQDFAIGGAVDINSTLTVRGDVSLQNDVAISSNLSIGRNISVSNDLLVGGDASLASNVDIGGNSLLHGDLWVLGETNLENTLYVDGSTTLASNLVVAGSVNLQSNIEIEGNSLLKNDLIVSGETNLEKTLYVDGTTTLASNLLVGGSVKLDSNINVVGDSLLEGSLTVLGKTNFNDNVFVSSNFGVGGEAYFEGHTYIERNLNVGGGIQVTGEALFDSDIIAPGTSYLNNLIVDGDVGGYGLTNFVLNMLSNNVPDLSTILSQLSNLSNLGTGGGGIIIDGNLLSNYEPCLAFHDPESVQIETSLIINSNLHVGGEVCFNKIRAKSINIGALEMSNLNVDGIVNGMGMSNFVLGMLSNLGVGLVLDAMISEPCVAFHDPDSVSIENSLIVQSNLHVEGEACIGKLRVQSLGIANFQVSNLAASNLNVPGNGYIDALQVGTLQVANGGDVNTNNIGVTGALLFQLSNDNVVDSNLDGWWRQYIEYSTNSVDLIFRSKRGTIITFQDEFYPEVLNFTGKHRCANKTPAKTKASYQDQIGMIVISTGEYKNLQGEETIGIDEAIPVIDLCKKEKDKRVFGVIGGVEQDGKFRIGNMSFSGDGVVKGARTIVQNTGEGGVWVCNWNGPIENGDYITTSPIKGLGMKQNENFNANFTCAKITCDCDFDLNSKVYRCIEFSHKNKKYRKAFVGCVYCC